MSYSPTSLPSPTTVNDGGSNTGGTNNIPNNGIINDTSSQSPSATLFIVVIVMASAIILLAFVFLLVRFLHIRKLRATAASSVALSRERISSNCFYGRNVSSPISILDSLPLFSYGTVTGNITGGDCAVCLSKFEAQDQLRLLPLCCHAFHARCIDTWLSSHMTCPLCRSSANPTDSDVFNEILTAEVTRSSISGNSDNNGGRSFRLEIGNVGNQRSSSVSGRRSYSIGQFEYIVNDVGYEVPVDRTHRRGVMEFGTNTIAADHKEPVVGVLPPAAPPHGERLVEEVDRSWLRDYVDRLGSSLSFSTRTLSIRSSGRFFTGSSRQSDIVLPVEDLEANRIGEEITELFRWLSGA